MTVEEYNQCVDAFSDGVYRFVLKHLRDKEAARDVVQDAFEKMWRRVHHIEGAKAKTYLFTTAYHTMVDFTRRESRKSPLEESHAENHSHDSQYSDLKEVLNRGLEQLPEIQKTVLLLRDYEGYDYSAIGEITGLTESQVKVYIFRARTFLKKFIGSMETVL